MARPPSRRKDRGGMLKTLLANTSLLVDGVSYGMVLFLMSVGLTVTLGVMRVANLAHCGFAMVGGYVALWLMTQLQVGFAVALVAGTALVLVCRVLFLSATIYRWIYSTPQLGQILMTIGLAFVMVEASTSCLGLRLIPSPFRAGCMGTGRRRRSLCRATAPSSLVLGLAIGLLLSGDP